MGAFADRVFAVVKQIPRGKVATYGQIARIIGAPRAARYVGYALRANPAPGTEPESIPCHRVVFKDGRMATGFAFGGPEIQQQMLEEEGVGFDEEGKVVMESFLWNGVPADESGLPMGPPSDFDWEAELAESPLHHCETCKHPRPDCQKSASSKKSLGIIPRLAFRLAGCTGLEPATSGVTGQRSNQLS